MDPSGCSSSYATDRAMMYLIAEENYVLCRVNMIAFWVCTGIIISIRLSYILYQQILFYRFWKHKAEKKHNNNNNNNHHHRSKPTLHITTLLELLNTTAAITVLLVFGLNGVNDSTGGASAIFSIWLFPAAGMGVTFGIHTVRLGTKILPKKFRSSGSEQASLTSLTNDFVIRLVCNASILCVLLIPIFTVILPFVSYSNTFLWIRVGNGLLILIIIFILGMIYRQTRRISSYISNTLDGAKKIACTPRYCEEIEKVKKALWLRAHISAIASSVTGTLCAIVTFGGIRMSIEIVMLHIAVQTLYGIGASRGISLKKKKNTATDLASPMPDIEVKVIIDAKVISVKHNTSITSAE